MLAATANPSMPAPSAPGVAGRVARDAAGSRRGLETREGLRLLLREHAEVGILVRRVLLVLGVADQVDAQALQPPSLDHRPFAHEADIVLVVRHGEADWVRAVVRAGLEEHAAFRRLDVPAELERLLHRLLVGRAGEPG